jgi:hypothetical protein
MVDEQQRRYQLAAAATLIFVSDEHRFADAREALAR